LTRLSQNSIHNGRKALYLEESIHDWSLLHRRRILILFTWGRCHAGPRSVRSYFPNLYSRSCKRSGHRLTVLQIPATLPTSVHQKLFQVTSTVYLALNMKLHLLCRHVGLGMDALKDEGFRLCKHCQFAKRKRYTGVRHDATIEGKGKKGDA
jgi:hypothetical protein